MSENPQSILNEIVSTFSVSIQNVHSLIQQHATPENEQFITNLKSILVLTQNNLSVLFKKTKTIFMESEKEKEDITNLKSQIKSLEIREQKGNKLIDQYQRKIQQLQEQDPSLKIDDINLDNNDNNNSDDNNPAEDNNNNIIDLTDELELAQRNSGDLRKMIATLSSENKLLSNQVITLREQLHFRGYSTTSPPSNNNNNNKEQEEMKQQMMALNKQNILKQTDKNLYINDVAPPTQKKEEKQPQAHSRDQSKYEMKQQLADMLQHEKMEKLDKMTMKQMTIDTFDENNDEDTLAENKNKKEEENKELEEKNQMKDAMMKLKRDQIDKMTSKQFENRLPETDDVKEERIKHREEERSSMKAEMIQLHRDKIESMTDKQFDNRAPETATIDLENKSLEKVNENDKAEMKSMFNKLAKEKLAKQTERTFSNIVQPQVQQSHLRQFNDLMKNIGILNETIQNKLWQNIQLTLNPVEIIDEVEDDDEEEQKEEEQKEEEIKEEEEEEEEKKENNNNNNNYLSLGPEQLHNRDKSKSEMTEKFREMMLQEKMSKLDKMTQRQMHIFDGSDNKQSEQPQLNDEDLLKQRELEKNQMKEEMVKLHRDKIESMTDKQFDNRAPVTINLNPVLNQEQEEKEKGSHTRTNSKIEMKSRLQELATQEKIKKIDKMTMRGFEMRQSEVGILAIKTEQQPTKDNENDVAEIQQQIQTLSHDELERLTSKQIVALSGMNEDEIHTHLLANPSDKAEMKAALARLNKEKLMKQSERTSINITMPRIEKTHQIQFTDLMKDIGILNATIQKKIWGIVQYQIKDGQSASNDASDADDNDEDYNGDNDDNDDNDGDGGINMFDLGNPDFDLDKTVQKVLTAHKRKVSQLESLESELALHFDEGEAFKIAKRKMKQLYPDNTKRQEVSIENIVNKARKEHTRKVSQFKAIQHDLNEFFPDKKEAAQLAAEAMKEFNPNDKSGKAEVVSVDTIVKKALNEHKRKKSQFDAIKNDLAFMFDETDVKNITKNAMKQVFVQKNRRRKSVEMEDEKNDEIKNELKELKSEKKELQNQINEIAEDQKNSQYQINSLMSDIQILQQNKIKLVKNTSKEIDSLRQLLSDYMRIAKANVKNKNK